MSCWIRLL